MPLPIIRAPWLFLCTWVSSQPIPWLGGRRIPVGLGTGPGHASGSTPIVGLCVHEKERAYCGGSGGGVLGSWVPMTAKEDAFQPLGHWVPFFSLSDQQSQPREDCHLRGSQLQKVPIVSYEPRAWNRHSPQQSGRIGVLDGTSNCTHMHTDTHVRILTSTQVSKEADQPRHIFAHTHV